MRFDRLIRAGMAIRDVKREYPETAAVFESFAFREPCDDWSIEQVSRKYGLNSRDVVDALNRALMPSVS